MSSIYGAIGYTILKNKKTNKSIIVFADMHDQLKPCKSLINIDDWIKNKFNTSKILLEEVPREGVQLKELWGSAKHTQLLKNLFLKNQHKIVGIDIRPYLIPFSWEVINEVDQEDKLYDITFREYICTIDDFISLNHEYLIQNLKSYKFSNLNKINLGYHFLKLKLKFKDYISRHTQHLDCKIKKICNENREVLQKLDNYLDKFMEWYTCSLIYENRHKPIVVHTGLMHSSNIIDLLELLYDYKKEKEIGVNTVSMDVFDNSETLDGCMMLSDKDDKKF